MFVPAPIDRDFVPYTKRAVLKHNAGLFVDGVAGRGRGTARVVPQQCPTSCYNLPDGTPCGANCTGSCRGNWCV